MCSEVKAGNFTTLVYCTLLNVHKKVLRMTETLWKNSLIIAKYARNIHIKFVVTAITFSEKKLEALLSYCPLQMSLIWKLFEAHIYY
jgi:hypothetical protein